MTAKASVFDPPNPLAERRTEPLSKSATPRTLPEPISSIAPRIPSNLSATYARMPLDNSGDGQRDGGITFAGQDKLPKLPIPDLASTCDKYLQALRPLQTPRERAETEHAVRDFLEGDGPDLQEKLKRYAQGKTSYIEQFCKWNDSSAPCFSCPCLLDLTLFVPSLPRRVRLVLEL